MGASGEKFGQAVTQRRQNGDRPPPCHVSPQISRSLLLGMVPVPIASTFSTTVPTSTALLRTSPPCRYTTCSPPAANLGREAHSYDDVFFRAKGTGGLPMGARREIRSVPMSKSTRASPSLRGASELSSTAHLSRWAWGGNLPGRAPTADCRGTSCTRMGRHQSR